MSHWLKNALRRATRPLRLRIRQGPCAGFWWSVPTSSKLLRGVYEAPFARFMQATLRPEDVFWDVGAHYGYYTLLAARAASRGACHAFEPFPDNFWFLEHHLRWNGLTRAVPHRWALAGRDGTRGFGGGAGSGTGRIDGGGLRVETRTLDSLVREGVCPAPTYLKIDVEGAEAEVVEGARTLRQQPNLLCVSTHGRDVHKRCLGLLKEFGHEVHDLESRALIVAAGPGRTVEPSPLAALAAWT